MVATLTETVGTVGVIVSPIVVLVAVPVVWMIGVEVEVAVAWSASAVWVAINGTSGVGVGVCEGRLQARAEINRIIQAARERLNTFMSSPVLVTVRVSVIIIYFTFAKIER